MKPEQINALATLQKQAIWFDGYFMRQAQRIIGENANDDDA